MTKEIKYSNIVNALTSVSCPFQELNMIKGQFCEGIDSARRLGRINNLSSLIKMLEKRDILNIEDISPLRCIATYLDLKHLIGIIDAYGAEAVDEPPVNIEPVTIAPNVMKVIPTIDPDPIQRVYDLICKEIGHKWKDLARALTVPEGHIDELEFRYLRISDMAREVIFFHRQNSDSRYWKVNLCNALVTARRKDLSLQVQEIFARHYLM